MFLQIQDFGTVEQLLCLFYLFWDELGEPGAKGHDFQSFFVATRPACSLFPAAWFTVVQRPVQAALLGPIAPPQNLLASACVQ
jgi:hypothetical protein